MSSQYPEVRLDKVMSRISDALVLAVEVGSHIRERERERKREIEAPTLTDEM